MDKFEVLGELYQARFDELKALATQHNISKNGSVESLRARLIQHLILDEWDLSESGIKSISNSDLGEILGVFGIKKSGSIKTRRQRLFLHLNYDPKSLTIEKLDDLTRDELHSMCKSLGLPLSGNKQALQFRVAGVISAQENAWGKVKRSLRRPKDGQIAIPSLKVEQVAIGQVDHVIETANTVESTSELSSKATIEEYEEFLAHEQGLVEVVDDASVELETIRSSAPEFFSLEVETALMELNSRMPEIRSASRDFLLVSSTTNQDDMHRFILSLRHQGFATDIEQVYSTIQNKLMELEYQIQTEKQASLALPTSWSEREAIRHFEEKRGDLRSQLEHILETNKADHVQARMAYEQVARDMNLDLRIPAVSGRIHALFDLHIELAETQARHDPVIQRRQRMLRILHHGSIHYTESERQTILRIERNISAFEELVQTVLEQSKDGLDLGAQALIIRFLENKGYDVNTTDLRPKIVACAGILGAELGFISASEIPKIAPGVLVTDHEVDSIIHELKHLAQAFKPAEQKSIESEPEILEAEETIAASQRVQQAKSNLDRVDQLLNRLGGSL